MDNKNLFENNYEIMHICIVCEKLLNNRSNLVEHENTHRKLNRNTYCNKNTKTNFISQTKNVQSIPNIDICTDNNNGLASESKYNKKRKKNPSYSI